MYYVISLVVCHQLQRTGEFGCLDTESTVTMKHT